MSNIMKIIYFSILLFSLVLLFPACATGKVEVNENNMESNNIVLVIDRLEQSITYFIYKYRGEMTVEAYENLSANERKILYKKLLGIDISQTGYKIGFIDDNLVILNGSDLYLFKLPIKDDGIQSLYYDKKILDVTNVFFCDNNCFYLNAEGGVFIYDKDADDFIQYLENKLPQSNEWAIIIKTEMLAMKAKNEAEKWLDSFVTKMINSPCDNISLDQSDDVYIRHWNNFRKYYISEGDYQSIEPRYDRFESWYNDIVKTEQEKLSERILSLKTNFDKKWGMEPDMNTSLFVEDISLYINQSIDTGKIIDIYKGKNDDIVALIDIYNKLLSTYSKLVTLLALSAESIKVLESSYLVVTEELTKLANQEEARFEAAKKEYFEKDFPFAYKESKKVLAESLGMLNLVSEEMKSDEFGYNFLPKFKNIPEYTIVYKKNYNNSILNKFHMIGQNIYLTSLFGKSIYVCENDKLSIRNPFTLQKEDITFDPNHESGMPEFSENILFFPDYNRNIVITEKKDSDVMSRYFIRRIEEKDNNFIIASLGSDVISNGYFDKSGMDEVFYIFLTEITDEYVYVNVMNPRPRDNFIAKRQYMYRETPSGAGIIFQRRSN